MRQAGVIRNDHIEGTQVVRVVGNDGRFHGKLHRGVMGGVEVDDNKGNKRSNAVNVLELLVLLLLVTVNAEENASVVHHREAASSLAPGVVLQVDVLRQFEHLKQRSRKDY